MLPELIVICLCSIKQDLINDLSQISTEENLHVFYYNDFDFKDHCNLMLFSPMADRKKKPFKRLTSIHLDVKCGSFSQKYPLHFGHFGSFKEYPLHGPHIKLMIDERIYYQQEIKTFKFNHMIKFKYVILYVEDVEMSMSFYKTPLALK